MRCEGDRHRRGLGTRSPVAGVPNGWRRKRPTDTVVAVRTIAVKQAVDAGLAEVVHGVHHRYAVRVRGADDPWRDQRVRIVQVKDIGPVLGEQPTELALGATSVGGRYRERGSLQRRQRRDLV